MLLGCYVILNTWEMLWEQYFEHVLFVKIHSKCVISLEEKCWITTKFFCKKAKHFQPSLTVTPSGVALRHLQYNNVRLHIHSTGIFLCWQSLLLEPRSLFRFPQLCPEGSLHLALLCSFHCSSPLSLSPKCKSIGKRQSNREFQCQI